MFAVGKAIEVGLVVSHAKGVRAINGFTFDVVMAERGRKSSLGLVLLDLHPRERRCATSLVQKDRGNLAEPVRKEAGLDKKHGSISRLQLD